MTYDEVIQTALTYADRSNDPELSLPDNGTQQANDSWLVNRMLRIIESKVNRNLQTRNQSKRAYIVTSKNKLYYGFPADFSGLRDIHVKTSVDAHHRHTLSFVTPEFMNASVGTCDTRNFYTIIDNQVHINPPREGHILEIIYYQKVMPLTAEHQTNWVSHTYPDLYIQGLMVEISSYTKDKEAAILWSERFQQTLDEMVYEDAVDRWSGPTPVTRTM